MNLLRLLLRKASIILISYIYKLQSKPLLRGLVSRHPKIFYYYRKIFNSIVSYSKHVSAFDVSQLNSYPKISIYKSFSEKGYYCVGYPSVLAIFLTTNCNLRCLICRREGVTGENMELENLHKLEKAIRFAQIIDLTGWGEPFIYPKFEDVLNYIFSINTGEVLQITTNGTKLSDRYAKLLSGHLKNMVISLNAACEATYNRDMVHGDFKHTITAVRSFLSGLNENDRTKISLYFVAHADNFRELPDFVALAHDLGIIKVSFGNYMISTREHVRYSLLNVKEEWNELIDRAIDIGKDLGVSVLARKFFQEQERPREQCESPFEEVFILPNGDVGPCCFSGNHFMGNAYKTSFEDVWFGTEYRRLREKRSLPACRTCNQFMPFDSFYTHFTGDFRVSKDFKEIEKLFTLS